MAGALAMPATSLAATQVFVAGNPSCADLNADNTAFPSITSNYGFKIDGSPNGTFPLINAAGTSLTGGAPPDPSNSITISDSNGIYFDWSATLGIDAVIVKGGPNAEVYVYIPESKGDIDLHAPINPENGRPYGLSHIEFCYDYELTASKTANATFTRTFQWSIEKSVTPDTHVGVPGSTFSSDYDVVVTKTGSTDSDWAVSGTITVDNPTPFAVSFSVSDSVGGTAATVNCPASTVDPGESVVCTYTASLASGANGVNTATITSNTAGIGGATATANYTFGDPTTIVNGTVNVTDSQAGTLGSTSDTKTFEYTKTDFEACSSDPARYTDSSYSYTVPNTATIVETNQSDNANVTVTCYAPRARKSAAASYDETHTWDVVKTVDKPLQSGVVGDVLTWTWTVTVTESKADSNYAVTGNIVVRNPAPSPGPSMTVSVADVLNDANATVGTVDCDPVAAGNQTSLTVAAGQEGRCSYTASPKDASATLNTATVTIAGLSVSATAAVSFVTNVIGEEATLTDTEIGLNELLLAGQGPWTRTGSGSHTCATTGYNASGSYSATVNNTATIDPNEGPTDTSTASTKYTCYAPVVTKTADTTFTRTYDWTIAKELDEDEPFTCNTPIGSLCPVSYIVTVTRTAGTDSDWAVGGTISVKNPSPDEPMTVDVADVVNGTAATVDCDAVAAGNQTSLTVAAGATGSCSYSASLGSGADRVNTATASIGGGQFSGTANVVFGNPTTEVDECVTVTDSAYGPLFEGAPVCATDTFSYTTEWEQTPETCAALEFVNTATFVSTDTPTKTGSDTVTVAIEVGCDVGNCTYTQGYWKTHSEFGPAPYDDTWALLPGGLGASTQFFISGNTWHQVLWTAPQGNAYYNLAHQYIAAVLSQLSGATSTPAVTAAMAYAFNLFTNNTPAQIAALKGPARNAVLAAAATLDAYNNGVTGPGHCTE